MVLKADKLTVLNTDKLSVLERYDKHIKMLNQQGSLSYQPSYRNLD